METQEHTVIFADLSGFTAMTETHGDIDAVTIAKKFKDLAEKSLDGNAHIVKTIGDAVMIVAEDAASAAQIVLKLAEAVHAEPHFPLVRIGMHHGSVVLSEGDYFGSAVNLAARVADYARAGQILCTSICADNIQDELDLELRDVGPGHFKNVSDPVSLYELCLATGPISVNIDPVCCMQVTDVNASSCIYHEGLPYYFCSDLCVKQFLEQPDKYVSKQ